eukprot:30145-Pelagococcus_subviridis.AAC.3
MMPVARGTLGAARVRVRVRPDAAGFAPDVRHPNVRVHPVLEERLLVVRVELHLPARLPRRPQHLVAVERPARALRGAVRERVVAARIARAPGDVFQGAAARAGARGRGARVFVRRRHVHAGRDVGRRGRVEQRVVVDGLKRRVVGEFGFAGEQAGGVREALRFRPVVREVRRRAARVVVHLDAPPAPRAPGTLRRHERFPVLVVERERRDVHVPRALRAAGDEVFALLGSFHTKKVYRSVEK